MVELNWLGKVITRKTKSNYSRSFWFDYLPFYHMGLRMNYKVNDKLAVNYWVTNGTQQTEGVQRLQKIS